MLDDHRYYEMIGVTSSHIRLLGHIVQGHKSPLEFNLWRQNGEDRVEKRNALCVGLRKHKN